MGYEIIYKKAFIRIDDKFIPIIQYGSNNCWETIWTSKGYRDCPEKNWGVWFYTREGKYQSQLLFNTEQIKEIASDISKPNSYGETYHKTRYTYFTQQELYNWFVNGMRLAKTVEEYLNMGNSIIFSISDYRKDGNGDYLTGDDRIDITEYIKSESGLLEIIEKYKHLVGIENIYFNVSFGSRELHKPKTRRLRKEKQEVTEAYCIKIDSRYLVKKRRYGYSYTLNPTSQSVKLFKTEAQAQTYINKYPEFSKAQVRLLNGRTFYV